MSEAPVRVQSAVSLARCTTPFHFASSLLTSVAELLRRAGLDVGAVLFHALDDLLVGQHLVQRLVELVDDRLGRLGRREEAVPLLHVDAVDAGLLQRRHVGQQRPSASARPRPAPAACRS